jgi:hypothetical protein
MRLASALLVAAVLAGADDKEGLLKPLFVTVDLDRNESQEMRLADGARAKVKLLDVEETRDSLRFALRLARVQVEINGSKTTLVSGNYQLPITVDGTGHSGLKATAHLQVRVAEKVPVKPED